MVVSGVTGRVGGSGNGGSSSGSCVSGAVGADVSDDGGSGGSRDGGVLKTKSAKLNELPQPVNLLETIRELFKNCN